MGEVKRFDFVCEESDEHKLSRDYSPDGQYVRYEDYAALKDERDRLAAEAIAYKGALDWLYDIVSEKDVSIPNRHYAAVTNAAAILSDGPTTDAYLAAIRAQAVEEFAESQKAAAKADNDQWIRAAYIGAYNDAMKYAAQIRTATKGEGVRLCKGTNCASDSFTPHSPECEQEHEKAVRGGK